MKAVKNRKIFLSSREEFARQARLERNFVVYVSGPISLGSWKKNKKRALVAGLELFAKGLVPMIPHLYNLGFEKIYTYEDLLYGFDFNIIRRCNAVLRLQGKSPGADKETAFARDRGKPVFTSVAEAVAYVDQKQYEKV